MGRDRVLAAPSKERAVATSLPISLAISLVSILAFLYSRQAVLIFGF